MWLFLTPPACQGSSQTLLPAAEGCICRVAAQLSQPLPVGAETVGVQIADSPREGASNKKWKN